METIVFGQWWRSHQSLACKGLCILRFCAMSWKGESEPNIKYCLGRTVGLVQKSTSIQNFGHDWRRTDGIRLAYFPRIVLLMPHLCLYSQKDLQQDVGHSSDLDQKRSGILLATKEYQENGTESLNWWWSNSEKADTQFSVSTVPKNAQKQRRWKIIYTLLCWWWYHWNCFSHNYFCWSAQHLRRSHRCPTRTVRPVLAGQSDPLFEPAKLLIMTPRPPTEILAQENLLQKYKQRVERLPQQDRLINICIDAGFLKTVEVGQCFMTKYTDEFLQFTAPVTCREYTLPRDEKSTDPKGWIRGNTKIGPVLEVTTSYLQGKYGVEIRIIEHVNKDNSHSWVRISHGLTKLVTDLSNNKE